MKGTIPMTPEGFNNLKEQLRQLEMEQWPAIVKEIEEARAHGDLSENAEYQYAKEKQGQLDAKIRQIKDRLARAEVIDPSKMSGDQAAFGAMVFAKNLQTNQEVKYLLVGPEEADVTAGKISIQSPIGKAFLGKKTGEEVQVETPGGLRSFEILKITWG
jgi:transcription elongation factor GreA